MKRIRKTVLTDGGFVFNSDWIRCIDIAVIMEQLRLFEAKEQQRAIDRFHKNRERMFGGLV